MLTTGDEVIQLYRSQRVLKLTSKGHVGVSSTTIEVDVRVLAATHHDLLAEVKDGTFREDLYYRLAVMTIEVPPLRHRRVDIPLLVDHFRKQYRSTGGEDRRFSREAMDRMVPHDYPGNVRELQNVGQRALALARGDEVTEADLPPSVLGSGSALPTLEATLPERVAMVRLRTLRREPVWRRGGDLRRRRPVN